MVMFRTGDPVRFHPSYCHWRILQRVHVLWPYITPSCIGGCFRWSYYWVISGGNTAAMSLTTSVHICMGSSQFQILTVPSYKTAHSHAGCTLIECTTLKSKIVRIINVLICILKIIWLKNVVGSCKISCQCHDHVISWSCKISVYFYMIQNKF